MAKWIWFSFSGLLIGILLGITVNFWLGLLFVITGCVSIPFLCYKEKANKVSLIA